MKFLYEYRTPDNAKHNGVICASDKEAAYAALKKQGIKPCRFAEAPGILNKLFGKGKRWMVIGVLGALCLVLGAVLIRTRHEAQGTVVALFDDMTRRQPIGETALIDLGVRTGWADVFALNGERYLASFAIPGRDPAVTKVTVEELDEALKSSCEVKPEDSIEVRQIKAMVEGMKRELRDYLAAGGDYVRYDRRIMRRQDEERTFYLRAKNEIESAAAFGKSREEIEALWRRTNGELRKMGIRLVSLPEGV